MLQHLNAFLMPLRLIPLIIGLFLIVSCSGKKDVGDSVSEDVQLMAEAKSDSGSVGSNVQNQNGGGKGEGDSEGGDLGSPENNEGEKALEYEAAYRIIME